MKLTEGSRNADAGNEGSRRSDVPLNRIQGIRSKLGALTNNPAQALLEDQQARRERECTEANEADKDIRERGVIVASAMLAVARKEDPQWKAIGGDKRLQTMRGDIAALVKAREAVIGRITNPTMEIGLTEEIPTLMANKDVMGKATVYIGDEGPFINACIARERRLAEAAAVMGKKSANWLYDWNKINSDLRVAVPLSAMLPIPPRVQDTKTNLTNRQRQEDRTVVGADQKLFTERFLKIAANEQENPRP